jgi:transcriptional antiterminator RfaH
MRFFDWDGKRSSSVLAARWYALCSKHHKEWVVTRQLKAKGYEVFCPRLNFPENYRKRPRSKPYFPGYLFVKVDFDTASLSAFKWMPHTEGLVCIDGIPAYVPDNLIEAIQLHLERISRVSKKLSLESHLPQLAVDGSLIGENDIFDPDLSDSDRVRALLRALNKMKMSPELSGF